MDEKRMRKISRLFRVKLLFGVGFSRVMPRSIANNDAHRSRLQSETY